MREADVCISFGSAWVDLVSKKSFTTNDTEMDGLINEELSDPMPFYYKVDGKKDLGRILEPIDILGEREGGGERERERG